MEAGDTTHARHPWSSGRRMLLPLFAVFVLSTCQDGCEEPTDLDEFSGSLSGTVYVNDEPTGGVTVSGVMASGDGATATTTPNGRYTLGGHTPMTVSASMTGVTFLDNARIVTLPTQIDVDFHGFRHATVSGRVLAGGAPVSGAEVRLSTVGADPRHSTSDTDGRYAFTNVPPTGVVGHSLQVVSTHPGVTWAGLTATLVVRGHDVTVDLVGSIVGSGIHGQVLWDASGVPGVTVTVTGPENVTRVTDAQGEYRTGFLPGGDYVVAISGFDVDAYPFQVTTRNVTLNGTLQVDFLGTSNQPPVATIVSPETGLVRHAGTIVTFIGEGQDPEDGELTDGALRWSSSIDGPLGTGWRVDVPLSLGTHTIRLVAMDSGGAADTATVTVQMVAPSASSGSVSGAVTGPSNAGAGGRGSPAFPSRGPERGPKIPETAEVPCVPA